MRRRLIQLGMILLLGAIVNVAVTWGRAFCVDLSGPPLRGGDGGMRKNESANVLCHARTGADCVIVSWSAFVANTWPRSGGALHIGVAETVRTLPAHRRWGMGNMYRWNNRVFPQWARITAWTDEIDEIDVARLDQTRYEGVLQDARGWPVLSLACESRWSQAHDRWEPVAPTGIASMPWGAPFRASYLPDRRFLPLRPLWPGFAINTLFYTVILWGLFAAPLALRRRIRISRGLCPACAYPIGESPVCTECGQPHLHTHRTGWNST